MGVEKTVSGCTPIFEATPQTVNLAGSSTQRPKAIDHVVPGIKLGGDRVYAVSCSIRDL